MNTSQASGRGGSRPRTGSVPSTGSRPSTEERCRLLLQRWRADLHFTPREQERFRAELAGLERQLQRLEQGRLRVAVFGRVGVGKSSLLNALLEEEVFATDVAHGCTRRQQAARWHEPLLGQRPLSVELVDTPGIDEIGAAGRARLAARVALGSDLVLLVLDGDLSSVELEALEQLRRRGKPVLLVLNRCDCWPPEEQQALLASIRRRLQPIPQPGATAATATAAMATAAMSPTARAAAVRETTGMHTAAPVTATLSAEARGPGAVGPEVAGPEAVAAEAVGAGGSGAEPVGDGEISPETVGDGEIGADRMTSIGMVDLAAAAAGPLLGPIAVAAAPRQAELRADGRVRSRRQPPRVEALRQALVDLLAEHGALLLALNSLRAADSFQQRLQQWRLQQRRHQAHNLIGRYAAVKASSVAANPLLLLDLAGGLACDTALVLQLSQLYGLPLHGPAARQLLGRLSSHNLLLGGAQLGIQAALGAVKQLLLLAAPLSGGLSLAAAGPVALAQAALAVHTTHLTGQLAASELLRSASRRSSPAALLRRLAASDPAAARWLAAGASAIGPNPAQRPGRNRRPLQGQWPLRNRWSLRSRWSLQSQWPLRNRRPFRSRRPSWSRKPVQSP